MGFNITGVTGIVTAQRSWRGVSFGSPISGNLEFGVNVGLERWEAWDERKFTMWHVEEEIISILDERCSACRWEFFLLINFKCSLEIIRRHTVCSRASLNRKSIISIMSRCRQLSDSPSSVMWFPWPQTRPLYFDLLFQGPSCEQQLSDLLAKWKRTEEKT